MQCESKTSRKRELVKIGAHINETENRRNREKHTKTKAGLWNRSTMLRNF